MNALFLCTGNSARSIIGEVILQRYAGGRFKAFSAGSRPSGEVNPLTLKMLETLGHETSGLRSKSWDEFSGKGAPHLHFVFTVCNNAAKEMCPVWPGQPMTARWGISDPAAVEGTKTVRMNAFQQAYAQLRRRIDIFLNLPLASLEQMALQEKLDEIGKN